MDRIEERFGSAGEQQPRIRFEVSTALPPSRFWFINSDKTELVQVQKDRFAQNWRRMKWGDEYPRYDKLRGTFETGFESFCKFTERENMGPVKPDYWEVTYVNHLEHGKGWNTFADLPQVIVPLSNDRSDGFLPPMEETTLSSSFLIPGSDGQPLGRLRVHAKPAYRHPDRRPLFVLELVARGKVLENDFQAILSGLDLGHEWIVRGFTSLTTPEMHHIWKRRKE